MSKVPHAPGFQPLDTVGSASGPVSWTAKRMCCCDAAGAGQECAKIQASVNVSSRQSTHLRRVPGLTPLRFRLVSGVETVPRERGKWECDAARRAWSDPYARVPSVRIKSAHRVKELLLRFK